MLCDKSTKQQEHIMENSVSSHMLRMPNPRVNYFPYIWKCLLIKDSNKHGLRGGVYTKNEKNVRMRNTWGITIPNRFEIITITTSKWSQMEKTSDDSRAECGGSKDFSIRFHGYYDLVTEMSSLKSEIVGEKLPNSATRTQEKVGNEIEGLS